MSPYQYVVLRCVPRVDREEFVNVGVVLYCQEADFLEARSHVTTERLRAIAPTIDVETVCSHLTAIEAVCRGEGPAKMLVTLGYAGWSAGQIEHELKQNAWLTVEAKDAILFDLPADERLPAAMELLGLDYARLADQAGHA